MIPSTDCQTRLVTWVLESVSFHTNRPSLVTHDPDLTDTPEVALHKNNAAIKRASDLTFTRVEVNQSGPPIVRMCLNLFRVRLASDFSLTTPLNRQLRTWRENGML